MVIRAIKGFLKAILFAIVTCAICIAVLMAMAIQGHAQDLNPYRDILASASEEDLRSIEEVVYWESAIADCPFETNCGVVETILNRTLEDGWGKSIYDVCHKRGQFVCKPLPKNISEHTAEDISDAIEYEWHSGSSAKFLPIESVYFATLKQSYGKEHIWLGERNIDGTVKRGKGMYFCISK